jgi:hypothetical protein
MNLWESLLAVLASLSSSPDAVEAARPPAAAAVQVAYAEQANDPAPLPTPAPPPPGKCEKCGDLGKVLKPGPGGQLLIEKCSCQNGAAK